MLLKVQAIRFHITFVNSAMLDTMPFDSTPADDAIAFDNITLSHNNDNDHDYNNDRIERRKSGFFFFFFTISSLIGEPSPTHTLMRPGRSRAHFTCNTSSAYHVQHVACHVTRSDSSAIKFDRVEIAFI